MGAEASKLQPTAAAKDAATSSPQSTSVSSPQPTESVFHKLAIQSTPSPPRSRDMPPPPLPRQKLKPVPQKGARPQYMVALSGWPQPIYAAAHPYARPGTGGGGHGKRQRLQGYTPFAEPPCVPLEPEARSPPRAPMELRSPQGIGKRRGGATKSHRVVTR